MIDNPLQFAVVREDPLVESEIVRRHRATTHRVLLVASGGCTALSLASLFPGLSLTLLDANPAQLAHVRKKAAVLTGPWSDECVSKLSVLNEAGNFESLFRGFRRFLHDLVMPYDSMKAAFEEREIASLASRELFSRKYWPVAFDLFFSDSLLNAMFGPSATQHAVRGSYPAYFRAAMERGLGAESAADNYFLHHIFLGHYLDRPEAWPPYLQQRPEKTDFSWSEGTVQNAGSILSGFDLVSLSNLFDWMEDGEVRELARVLGEKMRPGSVLVFRQLNNDADLAPLFRQHFDFDDELGRNLFVKDRSLFYCNLRVAKRK